MEGSGSLFWCFLGGIWGYLWWTLDLYSHDLMQLVDDNMYSGVGFEVTGIVPGWLIFTTMGVGLGWCVGIFMASGRTKY